MAKGVKKLHAAKNQEDEPEEASNKPAEAPLVAQPIAPKVITEADKKRSQDLLSAFTECMSALSSNKISTRNAFDVGLIDNLDEVIHMSGDSDDDEIKGDDIDDEIPDDSKMPAPKLSFTRASKAIESASRVYGYRVEAIYDQTFNVLASMNAANHAGDEQEDNQDKGKVKKKKTNFNNSNKTLLPEKDITMDVMPLDEGCLDPYFLKVSSLFDQAGAVGLLLANLQIETDLSLGFVGSNPIFPPYVESFAQDSQFHLTAQQIKELLFENPADLENAHVLPQINIYRNELKRLISGTASTSEKQPAPSLASLGASISNINENNSASTQDPIPDPADASGPGSQDLGADSAYGGIDDIGADMDIPQLPADLSTWDSPDFLNMPMDNFEQEKPDDYATRHIELNLMALDSVDDMDSLNFRKKRIKSILGELSVTKQKSESKKVHESEVDFQESLLEFVTGENDDYEIDSTVAKNMGFNPNIFGKDDFDSSAIEKKMDDLLMKGKLKVPPMDPNIAVDNTSSNAPFNEFFLTCLNATLNKKLKLMVSKDECYLNVANADDIDTPFSLFVENTIAELTHRAIVESDHDGDCDVDENLDTHALEELPEMPDESQALQSDEEENDGKADLATLGLNKNIDIAMIKQALSSVILPNSDFLDAVEDENQIDGDNQKVEEKPPEEQKDLTFRSAIKDTLLKLGTTDPSKGVNVHILFVCLLHVCNEHDVLLRQAEEAKTINILTCAPEPQHLT